MFSAEVYPTIRPLSRISVNCYLIADALIEFLESLHLVLTRNVIRRGKLICKSSSTQKLLARRLTVPKTCVPSVRTWNDSKAFSLKTPYGLTRSDHPTSLNI